MTLKTNIISLTTPLRSKISQKNAVKNVRKKFGAVFAGFIIGATTAPITIDILSAHNINKQIKTLQTDLVEKNYLDSWKVKGIDEEVNEIVDKNSSWFESQTSKATKKLLAWQNKLNKIGAEIMSENAYNQGYKDAGGVSRTPTSAKKLKNIKI